MLIRVRSVYFASLLFLAVALLGCTKVPAGGTPIIHPLETVATVSAAASRTRAPDGRTATHTPSRPAADTSSTGTPTLTPVETVRESTATVAATATDTPEPATSTATPTPFYAAHTVQTGQTLSEIALVYGLTVNALVTANDLSDPNQVREGQVLRVPLEAATPAFLSTRDYGYAIIGFSTEGRAIEVFSFGDGPNDVVFVGGIHGGYEWNTVLLAYEMIDYFNGNRDAIPSGATIHIVPAANPDGLYQVTGRDGRFSADLIGEAARAARFNGRGVDLNRNWSCGWSSSARWGSATVNPGSGPFSEPETRSLRDYFIRVAPRSVIFWHSAFGLVAAGQCGGDVGGARLAQVYGEAAGYPIGAFTAYALSGTASDWLSEQGIPAAAVELTTHESTEFGRNLEGVLATLALFTEEGIEIESD